MVDLYVASSRKVVLCVGGSGCELPPRVRIVVLAFVEDRPDDARVLVGDGDEGFSITDSIMQRNNPLLEGKHSSNPVFLT